MGVTVRYRATRERWIVTETHGRKRHQATFETEGEAEQYAQKRRAEIGEAVFNGQMGRKPKYSFMEALARWIEEYDTSSQANSIRQVAIWFADHAPEAQIGQPTLDAARKMQKDLRKAGKSQSTINNRTQVVKRVLSLAFKEWDWLDVPLDGKLGKPNPKNERHVYLTEEEVRALVLAVPNSYPEERRLIALAALTGLRRGELFSLDPSNIQGGRIILRPGQTKSGKARIVPLPTDGGYLVGSLPFRTDEHKLRKAFEVAREAIGRRDMRFHDLRHTYASMLAEAGEVMTTVQALLGHSSLVVTSRYAHMFDSRLDQVAAKLPRICDQTATNAGGAKGLDKVTH